MIPLETGENLFLFALPVSGGWPPEVYGSSFTFKSTALHLSALLSFFLFMTAAGLLKDLLGYMGPIWVIQAKLSLSWSLILIPSSKSLFAM